MLRLDAIKWLWVFVANRLNCSLAKRPVTVNFTLVTNLTALFPPGNLEQPFLSSERFTRGLTQDKPNNWNTTWCKLKYSLHLQYTDKQQQLINDAWYQLVLVSFITGFFFLYLILFGYLCWKIGLTSNCNLNVLFVSSFQYLIWPFIFWAEYREDSSQPHTNTALTLFQKLRP